MTTQELINKTELSDTIFELLSPVYARTNNDDTEVQYRKMKMRANDYKEQGLLPSNLTDTTIVREFFNRL